MKMPITAGNKGPKVRGDCFITFEPETGEAIEVQVKSRVQALYGSAIKEMAQGVLAYYGIDKGRLTIEDAGAFDFVIAARVEACVKQFIDTNKDYLPEMLPANIYKTSRKRLRLSRLYLPGNSPKMMINAGVHTPHAVILDLEDAVAAAKKDEARLLVRNALRQVDFYGAERMVRINQLPLGLQDLEQVAAHGVHVILIPKCESGDEVAQVNSCLASIQDENSLDHEIFLMPIIESARGVLNAEQIAGSADNIVAMAIGLEDFTADLGIQRTGEGMESFHARSHLVKVCKAYGIQAIDSVFSDVSDTEALARTVQQSKTLGFEGMGCIHPRQIKVIHEGYAPKEEELKRATTIVDAFEKATREGIGVVSLGTKMIDAPVVERAKQTIAAAIQLGKLAQDWRINHG